VLHCNLNQFTRDCGLQADAATVTASIIDGESASSQIQELFVPTVLMDNHHAMIRGTLKTRHIIDR